ncbi:MAG TPA: alpha/beta hydrolase, partial [Mycobacteriales bacterium]|nr:alpha/beta hydrolase [Mycobacteriales bacterium]
ARSLIGLVEDLGTGPVVMAGYDIGSRIAQAVARTRPDLVRALILAPPLPGIGKRILTPNAQHEFWYQSFHQLALCEQLIADEISARTYLAHFWNHWSGPGFVLDGSHLDRLAYSYSAPGAFRASIAWYRAGAGSIATSADESPPPAEERIQPSTTVLWPSHDPLFPRAWSDRLDQYFCDFVIRPVSGAGHFAPLEYPQLVADAIADTS